jgi:hypothetical protein
MKVHHNAHTCVQLLYKKREMDQGCGCYIDSSGLSVTKLGEEDFDIRVTQN